MAGLATTIMRFVDAVGSAAQACDTEALTRLYDAFTGATGNPRLLLQRATSTDRAALRAWYETWDGAVRSTWLREDGAGDWAGLLLTTNDRFRHPHLLSNGWWLAMAGSNIVASPAVPPELEGMESHAAAVALGRFLVRADARSELDYSSLASATPAALRPALVHWFLTTWLHSPLHNLDPDVVVRRRASLEAFGDQHQAGPPVRVRAATLTSAGYRAAYLSPEPRAFLSALSRTVLAPSLPMEAPLPTPTSGGPVGIVLSCFTEGHAVERCVGPLLRGLSGHPLHLYSFGEDNARRSPAWLTEAAASHEVFPAAPGLRDMAAIAHRIARDGLDLLFYPEVGITGPSRWLSCQRLARVQATAYGHPITSGSPEMDFFVVGSEIEGCLETAADRYSERLVVLPGLGVGSTVPPTSNSTPGEALQVVSLSSLDKLNAPLLATWRASLLSLDARLQLLPGLSPDHAQRVAPRLGEALRGLEVGLSPAVPRQVAVDMLARSHLGFDSFPFGGYNTLVEALAVRCPVVTLETGTAAGRFGAALLRRVGLDALITHSPEEFTSVARGLLGDRARLDAARASLDRQRVLSALCTDEAAEGFQAAVQAMLQAGPGRGPPLLT
jgi:hypothetical protein